MCLHFHKNLLEITITQIIGQVDITFTPREATESHKNIYKNTQSYRFKAHNQNCMCVCAFAIRMTVLLKMISFPGKRFLSPYQPCRAINQRPIADLFSNCYIPKLLYAVASRTHFSLEHSLIAHRASSRVLSRARYGPLTLKHTHTHIHAPIYT